MENTFKLDDLTFPLLIKDVIDTKFTGIIFVSNDKCKKGLIFKKGLLCTIQSNNPDELLGNIMVQMEMISEEQNELSLDRARNERTKQGVALLDMDLLNSKDIKKALRRQIELRFLDIFSWEEGVVQKVEKKVITKPAEITKKDFSRLIRTGIMESTPFSSIITALSPYADAMPKKLVDDMPKDMGVQTDNVNEYKVSELLLLGQDPPRALLGLYCTGAITFEESKHKALIEKLRQHLKEIRGQNPYEILNIDPSISDGGLKRAYIKVVKNHHPDTYSYADDPEVKRIANEIFTVIQKAYTNITKIRAGNPPEEPKGLDDDLQAEIIYSQATECLKVKDYKKALDYFKICLKMKPDEKLFTESYIKTFFLVWQSSGKRSSVEIKSAIHDGVNKFPNSDVLYLILGWVLKKEGSKRAIEAFRKALQLNNNNIDAQREIRLYQMRN